MHNLLVIIATGFFSGYSKFAPGTVGTLVGLLIYFFTSGFGFFVKLIFAAVIFGVGYYAAEYYSKFSEKSDPSEVVIDEIAAFYLLLLFTPHLGIKSSLALFFLFRIFDVVKPYPVRNMEYFDGGKGIMLDDIMAAAYAYVSFIILRLIF